MRNVPTSVRLLLSTTRLPILSKRPISLPSKDLAGAELVHSRGRVLGDKAGNDSPYSDSALSEPALFDCEPPLTCVPRGRLSNKRKIFKSRDSL